MPDPTSLFTCRYWALGSGCPNITNGKNICRFAHWDAGRLAASYDQRGTCRWWLQGNCRHGSKCYFEHRHTGVSAMYQDRLILNGFNLEVANAAANAGFDTFNHAALYDLIWAVKRVAFRASKGAILDRPRPPKDPVYPDRFRPSGVGDNTKRKRPAPQNIPSQKAAVKLETVIKPQTTSRNYRYKNKKAPARPKQAPVARPSGIISQGTQEDPVEVLSDGEEARGAGQKRQKIDTARGWAPGPANHHARVSGNNSRAAAIDTGTHIQQHEPITRDAMQVNGRRWVRLQEDDAHPDNQGLDEPQLQSLRTDLRKVKDMLHIAATKAKLCNSSMSSHFEKYSILTRTEIHSLLSPLSESFEIAKESSLRGIGYLNDILELLR